MKLKKVNGIMMGILACFLWSTAFAGVKIGFRYLPAPFTFAGLRFTLAGLILIPFCWRRDAFRLMLHHRRLIAYVVLLNTAIGYALYYIAMSYVDGATASIIIGTGPLITAVMTHFLMEDDKLDRGKLMSILVGMLGIVVIITNSKPVTPVGRKEVVGILLLLINSTLTSYANIKVAEMKGGIDGRFLTSNQMLWGGLLLLLMGRLFEGSYNIQRRGVLSQVTKRICRWKQNERWIQRYRLCNICQKACLQRFDSKNPDNLVLQGNVQF